MSDDPAGGDDQIRIFTLGTRRYTTVVDINALEDALIEVPPDQVSDAKAKEVGDVVLNVRRQKGGGDVVALARAGSNLVVAPVDAVVEAAQRMPLDLVNSGERANITLGDYKFQARELDQGTVLPLGPESQLTVVVPDETAQQIFLVEPDALADPQFFPVGDTDLPLYTRAGLRAGRTICGGRDRNVAAGAGYGRGAGRGFHRPQDGLDRPARTA